MGGRHNARLAAARSIGGVAAEVGLSDTEAEEMLIAARPPEIEEEKERKTIRDGLAYGRAEPIDLNGLPDSAQFREYQQHRGNGVAPPPPQPDPRLRRLLARMLPTLSGGHFSDAEQDSGGPAQDGELRPDPDGEPAELPVIVCAARPTTPHGMSRPRSRCWPANVAIYQRTMLVRPTEVEYDAAPPSGSKEPRKTHSTALVAVTAPALTKMLSRAAIFMKWNERKKQNVVCDPPSKLVDIILASRGEWTFPVVRGVLTTPTLRPDGSVLKTPGYDPISRYYLTFPSNLVLPDIPEAPTREQAAESLQRLDRLLDGYAFADETGVFRAVALAMLMTQVLRCAMPVSPLEAVSATAPGTGKSHLVDLASTIAVGRPCPIINAGKNDEETEKGINTKLISGIPGFSIDNVQRELTSKRSTPRPNGHC